MVAVPVRAGTEVVLISVGLGGQLVMVVMRASIVAFVRILARRFQRPLWRVDLVGSSAKLGCRRVGVLAHRVVQVGRVVAVLRVPRWNFIVKVITVGWKGGHQIGLYTQSHATEYGAIDGISDDATMELWHSILWFVYFMIKFRWWQKRQRFL